MTAAIRDTESIQVSLWQRFTWQLSMIAACAVVGMSAMSVQCASITGIGLVL